MILYHGSENKNWAPHDGACFTDSLDSAANYGDWIQVIELCEDVEWVAVEGYDRETNTAPGDVDPAILPAPVVEYDDEDPCQREHTTWRIRESGYAVRIGAIKAEAIEEHGDRLIDLLLAK